MRPLDEGPFTVKNDGGHELDEDGSFTGTGREAQVAKKNDSGRKKETEAGAGRKKKPAHKALAKKKPIKKKEPADKKPPGQPPKAPPGASGDHEKRVEEIHSKIDKALNEAELSPEISAEYDGTAKEVIARMTPIAMEHFHRNVKDSRFYASPEDLTAAFQAKYPGWKKKPGSAVKGVYDKDGVIHLNGGGILFGRPAGLAEFHGHEMSHAIDGPDHVFSSSDAWQQAWEAEIKGGNYLGNDAKKDARSGFAEFGAMLLTGTSSNDAAEVLPLASQYWSERGLI